MLKALLAVCCLAVATTAHAQDTNNDGAVSVLLPIAYSRGTTIPGAQGSQWQMELWLHNDSALAISALQPMGGCFPPCVDFPAGYIGPVRAVHTKQGDSGAILVLSPEEAAKIHLSARLLETTRRAQPTGVELPVVREDDFLRTPTTLLAIPGGEGIRSTLRVYDPRGQKGSALRVEFLDEMGEIVATHRLHPGNDPAIDETPSTYRILPGYDAMVDLTGIEPSLSALPRYHVRLVPETPGMEYWGFVSVTDNETQHVLLITPQ